MINGERAQPLLAAHVKVRRTSIRPPGMRHDPGIACVDSSAPACSNPRRRLLAGQAADGARKPEDGSDGLENRIGLKRDSAGQGCEVGSRVLKHLTNNSSPIQGCR
jgi:hypothetical protein